MFFQGFYVVGEEKSGLHAKRFPQKAVASCKEVSSKSCRGGKKKKKYNLGPGCGPSDIRGAGAYGSAGPPPEFVGNELE